MSWLEKAFEQGSKQAERLPEGPIRDLAQLGLEGLGDEEVVEVLERNGEDALLSLAAGVIGGGAELTLEVFASEAPGIAGVFEELDDAHAKDVAAFDREAQARRDRAVVLKAIAKVGAGAARLGFALLVAGL